MQPIAFVALSVFLLQVAAEDPDYISGTYKIDPAASKFDAKLMEAKGMPPEEIKQYVEIAPTMGMTIEFKDGKIVAAKKTGAGGKKVSYNIDGSGKEFMLERLVGDPVKATATIGKNEFTVKAQFPKGEVTCVTKCDKDGCTSSFKHEGSGATGNLRWKRQ